MPFLEALWGGPTHGWCAVCRHPDRATIESELSSALTNKARVKGLNLIAEKHGLSYKAILGHAGRVKTPVPYRGETLRSHMRLAAPAPALRCPVAFIMHNGQLDATALILYPLLLLEGMQANNQRVECSAEQINQKVGLHITEHQLSVGLNHLLREKLVESFSKTPNGFSVTFPIPSQT